MKTITIELPEDEVQALKKLDRTKKEKIG